jgi:hypothetical protein
MFFGDTSWRIAFKQGRTLASFAKCDGFGHVGLCLLSPEELRIAVQSVQWLDDVDERIPEFATKSFANAGRLEQQRLKSTMVQRNCRTVEPPIINVGPHD